MIKLLWSTLLTAATFASVFASSASAFTLSFGGTSGPLGITNSGTYSSVANTTTVDFNLVVLTGGSFTSGIATYSGITGSTAIKADRYAPLYTTGTAPTSTGTTNNSNYLATFSSSSVTLNFTRSLDYFGFDWGFEDSGNSVSFYQGTTLLATFTAPNVFNGYPAEVSSYVNFFSQNSGEYFDRIVFTNGTSTGFETDNHAYRQVDEPYPFVVFIGLIALGINIRQNTVIRLRLNWNLPS